MGLGNLDHKDELEALRKPRSPSIKQMGSAYVTELKCGDSLFAIFVRKDWRNDVNQTRQKGTLKQLLHSASLRYKLAIMCL